MPEGLNLHERATQLVVEASGLERLNSDGFPEDALCMPRQFGNNFYLFFKARSWQGSEDGNPMRTFFLEKTAAWGEVWTTFENEHGPLLKSIDNVLSKEAIYARVRKLYSDFIFSESPETGYEFNAQIDPLLGIEAIGIPIWNHLNILLEEAAEAMESVGIDTKELFK